GLPGVHAAERGHGFGSPVIGAGEGSGSSFFGGDFLSIPGLTSWPIRSSRSSDTLPGSFTLSPTMIVRSPATLARLRNKRAKQVSQPPSPYSPCQLPSACWLASSSSAPQRYQSLPAMVLKL